MESQEKNNNQPISIGDLRSLSNKIIETEKMIESKKTLIESEKNNKNQGFFCKIFTALFVNKKSDTEIEIEKLTSELSGYKTKAQSLSSSYLFEQANIRLKENNNDYLSASSTESKIKYQSERMDKLLALHDSIHNTSSLLKIARDHHYSGSVDNTYSSTEEAYTALLTLIRDLPDTVREINLNVPDDLSDTILDVSKWFNPDLILDKCVTDTNEFIESLGEFIGYLNNTEIAVNEIIKRLKHINQTLIEELIIIKKPYFNQVRNEMPDNLFPFWQPV